jgi:hypothetical protein
MEKPATPPASALPAVNDDLFGEPATPAPLAPADLFDPAPATPAPNAAPPMDGLFGDAKISEPAAPAPAPAPAPASGLDDLFGTEPAPAAPEMKPPADKNDLNDLFNSTEPATPSFDSGDTIDRPAVGRAVSTDMPNGNATSSAENADVDALFGTPQAGKPIEKSESSESLDDLFNTSPASSQSIEANTQKAPESSLDSDLDNLFKTSSDTTVDRDSFRGAEFRAWNDNTGDFSVSARLSVIFPDRIRLLKDNGKFTTVPLNRLSPSDQQYVGWVATSLQKTGATKLVNTQTDPGTPTADLTR